MVLAATAISACRSQPEPDLLVDGVGVKIETTRGWARAADFERRFHTTVDVAARYAGGSYADVRGWLIVIQDSHMTCGSVDAVGCTDASSGLVEVTTWAYADCVEQSPLVHEVLHVVMGDHCHRSPLWRDFQPVADELAATHPVREVNGVEEPCAMAPFVWREVQTCDE